MSGVLELERVSIVAPLGVRFRDRATNMIVSDGLSASVWPAAAPDRRVPGVENRAGTFTFFNLPGLREVEQGSGDADFWDSHPPQFDFILAVRDRSGRFLPLRIAATLPIRGVVTVPLASAPSRTAVEGMAAIHADLFDADHDEPAAWAMIEVTTTDVATGDERTATGFADGSGRLMLPLPWPPPVLSTPSGPPPPPLTAQSWDVSVAVRYRRPVASEEVPLLADVLAQPLMRAWQDAARTVPFNTATLTYGRELVLRTTDEPESRLLITA